MNALIELAEYSYKRFLAKACAYLIEHYRFSAPVTMQLIAVKADANGRATALIRSDRYKDTL